MVAVVQLVRASDCGSECRGFESHLPPFRAVREMIVEAEHSSTDAPLLFFCVRAVRRAGWVVRRGGRMTVRRGRAGRGGPAV